MQTLYTKEHEWIRIDGSIGVIGITEYAVGQLGDITFVELPPLGREVKQFEVLSGIESVKAASDIYAPLAGKVVAVNETLDTHPEIINESPEDKGWLAEIEITDAKGVEKLLNRAQYDEYVQGLQ
ncbi:MAG TPA: glycine cleavage system protein GcvH [Geobacteraceae bacterium]|jgi:glycine cleavage system H protein|nr:glycine cleavage system protein GcvH [Geobacteraceae bacterium]